MIYSKSFSFSIIAFLALLVVMGLSPWTAKYPISAKLVYQPKLLVMRAPVSGVLKNQNIHSGDKVDSGQELFLFQPNKSLMNKSYEQYRLKQLEKKLKFYEKELKQQRIYLHHLKKLFQKKLIAAQEYQQKKAHYYQLFFKKQETLEKIHVLQHQQIHRLQAPIAGNILKLFSQNGEFIYKNQKLAIIKPNDSKLKLLLQVPIDLKDKVFLGQTVRLAWQNQTRVQNYPIVAKVQEISPILKKDKMVLLAQIQEFNTEKKNIFSKLSFNGYLIGQRQAFWKCLKNSLMGE